MPRPRCRSWRSCADGVTYPASERSETQERTHAMATASTLTSTVTTGLFIGGKERRTPETMAIADPAKPGIVVGHAASASAEDVRDAVAAAKAAYPAWAALTPQQRAEKMMAALQGIDGANRDADAAILSQENGKVRFEAWV